MLSPRTAESAHASWPSGDRLVFERERASLTGLSRPWWYCLERRGQVPRRIKLSERRVAWYLSELQEWIRARAAMRDDGGGDARPAV